MIRGHRPIDHAHRRPVGVGDVRVDDPPAVLVRPPPRRALGRSQVQLAGDDVAGEVSAGVVAPATQLGRIGDDQTCRGAVWVDDVQAVVDRADEQTLVGGHDPGRHRRERKLWSVASSSSSQCNVLARQSTKYRR